MSVSPEPVDVPETVESETPPTPTQIEESESNQTISPTQIRQGRECKPKESESNLVKSQGGENPVEAREGIPSVSAKPNGSVATSNGSVRLQCDENPVKKRGHPRKEVPKEPNTPTAAPKQAVRMRPPSPVNEVNESSSEEETPLTRGNMGTWGHCYWTTLSNANNCSNLQEGQCGVGWLGRAER